MRYKRSGDGVEQMGVGKRGWQGSAEVQEQMGSERWGSKQKVKGNKSEVGEEKRGVREVRGKHIWWGNRWWRRHQKIAEMEDGL